MMHPCLQCEVYTKTGRNHGPDCEKRGCSMKAEYVEALGDMSRSVPDSMTTWGGNAKGAFMAPEVETKVCKDPNCINAGEKQPVSNFHGKRGGGTKDTCSDCVSRKLKKAKKKREAEKKTDHSSVIDIKSRKTPPKNKSFFQFKSRHNLQLGVVSFPDSDMLAIVGMVMAGDKHGGGMIQHRIMPLRREAAVMLNEILNSYLDETA